MSGTFLMSLSERLAVEELSSPTSSTAKWTNSSNNFSNGTRLEGTPGFCDVMSISASTVSYTVGMVSILVIAVVGNALVLAAMLMSPNLRQRVTTLFIVSLACSDIAFAVCLIPFKVSMSLHNDLFCLPISACYWYLMTDAFVNVTSILNLFLIAMDRFIAIKLPFQYREVLSRSRAKVLIAIVWLFAMIWAILGVIQWEHSKNLNSVTSISLLSVDEFGRPGPPRCINSNKLYYVVSASGLYLVPLAIMTLAYIRILMVALSQIRAIEATQVSIGQFASGSIGTDLNLSNGVLPDPDRRKRNRNRKRKKELRATKSVAIVYCAFVICFVPSMIITFIIFGDPNFFATLYNHHPSLFLFIFYTFIEVLPVLNSCLNPFIYSFSNKQFRHAFKRALYRLSGQSVPPENLLDSAVRLDGSPSHVSSPRISMDNYSATRAFKGSGSGSLLLSPRSGLDTNSLVRLSRLPTTPEISSPESSPTPPTTDIQCTSLCCNSSSPDLNANASGLFAQVSDRAKIVVMQDNSDQYSSDNSDQHSH